MTLTTLSVSTSVIVGLCVFVVLLFSYMFDVTRYLKKAFALGAGFTAASVLLFVLPAVYKIEATTGFFVLLGVIAVPVLHLLLFEAQPDARRVTTPMAGLLSGARVAIIGLVYGAAVSLLGSDVFTVVIFGAAAFFVLAAESLDVYTLLHFEGTRKSRVLLLTGPLALMPLIATLIVGSVLFVVLPELSLPFVGFAAGTMLYSSVADRIHEALRKRSWVEIGLAVLGASIASLILVFL